MDTVKFNQALKQGACDVVDAMLEQGYIPSSIQTICKNGNLTLLRTLLRYPMNVQDGLFIAVRYNHKHLLDDLYLFGADVNFVDNCGNTPLYYVDDIETCKWLLDIEAKQIQNIKNQITLLYRACYDGRVEIVKLLLDYEQGIENISKTTDTGEYSFVFCLLWQSSGCS